MYLLFPLIFCSCASTEEMMEEETLDIRFLNIEHCSAVNIYIQHGDVVPVDECHSQITFHKARGGKTFLFGIFEIKNKSPKDINLVTISYNDGKQYVTSYNELKELQFETIKGDTIYLIDELKNKN